VQNIRIFVKAKSAVGGTYIQKFTLVSRDHLSPAQTFNPFSPTLFLIVAKMSLQSVQRHTGLTHPF